MFGRKKNQAALRDDIAAAADAGRISNSLFGKTLRRLEPKLINGEQVLTIATGHHGRQAGLLVHTTHRVLFTVESVAGTTMEAVALERVSSVRWERPGGAMTNAGTLTVNTPNREMVFNLVPQTFALTLQSAAA